jgi:hypothetical protein
MAAWFGVAAPDAEGREACRNPMVRQFARPQCAQADR